jgi:hypothetical protein
MIYGKIYKNEHGYTINDGMYAVRPGTSITKDIVEAYLLDHPEALIDEPKPPQATPEQVAAAEAARIETEEAEKDRAFGRAIRLAAEAGEESPIVAAMNRISAFRPIKTEM